MKTHAERLKDDMESKQPTPEQIKEFWEWCGLHYNKPTGGFFWDNDDNLVIDLHKGETGIDLNNLFKYAIPRLNELGYDYKLWSDDGYHFAHFIHMIIYEGIAGASI